jgi:hypothetical protein
MNQFIVIQDNLLFQQSNNLFVLFLFRCNILLITMIPLIVLLQLDYRTDRGIRNTGGKETDTKSTIISRIIKTRRN